MLQKIIKRLTTNSYAKSNINLLNRFIFTNPVLKILNHSIMRSYKIIFYGTDELSKVTLNMLNINRLSSAPDKVVDNLEVVCIKLDCAVRRYASSNNLTIHTWPYKLPENEYDVGVVVSFGHMIPPDCIRACKYGIINAHPSLLPRWRGAAPIFHAILNGDPETGVTITQVSPNKFDVGKILLQETYRIPDGFTSKDLMKELSQLAGNMVLKTLKNLPEYLDSSYPQSMEGVTYARKIKPHQCCIDWNQETSTTIIRKFRAFNEIFDVYTFWNDMKVTILKYIELKEVESVNLSSLISHPVYPGYCFFHKKRKILFVKCKNGWCGITVLRIPKKGKITALDFYNGFMTKVNINKCYFALNDNKIYQKYLYKCNLFD